jgi:hypothetical protein
MPSLNEFISLIKDDGLAKEYRFEVVITPPFSLSSKIGSSEKLIVYCQSASIPGLNFLSNPVITYGESREVIYNRTFEPVELEFLVNSHMESKIYFDEWADTIVDPVTRMHSYYADYVGTVDISQLLYSINGKEARYTVRLHEAFPKAIQPIQYSYSSKEFTKFRVSLQYKYWTVSEKPVTVRQSELDVPDSQSTDTPI